MLYVLARADDPEMYGLPRDPQIPWTVWLWKGPLKWVGNALLIGGILGTLVHYLKYGPRAEEGELNRRFRTRTLKWQV